MHNLQSKLPPLLLKILAIGLASLAALGRAVADDPSERSILATQANTGFYAALAPGRSSERFDIGAAAHTASHEISGNPLGLQIAAGYRPLPAWSGEADYVRLGRISSGHSRATIDGLMLSALGYLPTPVLNLYGRVGLFDARMYGAYEEPGVPHSIPVHHHNTNLAFGVGLTTNFARSFNVRLESQGFQVTHAKNTSLVSIAFVWSFL